jgi:hypothetical protein
MEEEWKVVLQLCMYVFQVRFFFFLFCILYHIGFHDNLVHIKSLAVSW